MSGARLASGEQRSFVAREAAGSPHRGCPRRAPPGLGARRGPPGSRAGGAAEDVSPRREEKKCALGEGESVAWSGRGAMGGEGDAGDGCCETGGRDRFRAQPCEEARKTCLIIRTPI